MTNPQIPDNEPLALAPAVTTYYLYDIVEGTIGLYRGNSVQLPVEAPQPKNSSKWAPPVGGAGIDVYFDGIGWFYGLPYESITPAMRVAAAKDKITQIFEADETLLYSPYSQSETKSWLKQEAEAKAYAATGQASAFLTAYAASQNLSVEDLVSKILAKAATYETEYAKLLGRYKLELNSITEQTAPPLTADYLRR